MYMSPGGDRKGRMNQEPVAFWRDWCLSSLSCIPTRISGTGACWSPRNLHYMLAKGHLWWHRTALAGSVTGIRIYSGTKNTIFWQLSLWKLLQKAIHGDLKTPWFGLHALTSRIKTFVSDVHLWTCRLDSGTFKKPGKLLLDIYRQTYSIHSFRQDRLCGFRNAFLSLNQHVALCWVTFTDLGDFCVTFCFIIKKYVQWKYDFVSFTWPSPTKPTLVGIWGSLCLGFQTCP